MSYKYSQMSSVICFVSSASHKDPKSNPMPRVGRETTCAWTQHDQMWEYFNPPCYKQSRNIHKKKICLFFSCSTSVSNQSSTSISTSSSSESLWLVWSEKEDDVARNMRNLCALWSPCLSWEDHCVPMCPLLSGAFPSRSASKGMAPTALADSTSAFSSSMSRFSLARRFWNQVMTCALLNASCCATWSRSTGDKYFWRRNRFSSS